MSTAGTGNYRAWHPRRSPGTEELGLTVPVGAQKLFSGCWPGVFPLVSLCTMQMRTATSDPELVRHFSSIGGRKGQKLTKKKKKKEKKKGRTCLRLGGRQARKRRPSRLISTAYLAAGRGRRCGGCCRWREASACST